MKVPCYKCTERTSTCHAVCERYLLFKKEREEILEAKHKANNVLQDFFAMRSKSLGSKRKKR